MPAALEQGSLEWHIWRESHANASEAPAVMDKGRFRPRNRRELCMVRNGTMKIPVTPAMRRGSASEGGALERLRSTWTINGIRKSGLHPEVLSATIEGIPMSASLDGRDGDVWVEIKHVMSEESPYWTEALEGRIEESVLWQMTNQFIVGREHGVVNGYLLVVCHGREHMVPYTHDDAREDALLKNWATVWPHITNGTVYSARSDEEWAQAAHEYLSAKRHADDAARMCDTAKAKLLALANGEAISGSGVTVQKVERSGYDYSALPADVLATLPKKHTSYWTVLTTKGNTKE